MKLLDYIILNTPVSMEELKQEYGQVHSELVRMVEQRKIFVAPVEGELMIMWYPPSMEEMRERVEVDRRVPYGATLIMLLLVGGLLYGLAVSRPPYSEDYIIIESAKYVAGARTYRITFVPYRRGYAVECTGSAEGWIYSPNGPSQFRALVFDRTDPPDPVLEVGQLYHIRHTNPTGSYSNWRVVWIEEVGYAW